MYQLSEQLAAIIVIVLARGSRERLFRFFRTNSDRDVNVVQVSRKRRNVDFVYEVLQG